jgi:hypothetical protein
MARIGGLQRGRALASAESLPESVSSVKSVVKLHQGRELSRLESLRACRADGAGEKSPGGTKSVLFDETHVDGG